MIDDPHREAVLIALAKEGLRKYMRWWSEQHECAGWSMGLPTLMWSSGDKKYRDYVLACGGSWDWGEDDPSEQFVAGLHDGDR